MSFSSFFRRSMLKTVVGISENLQYRCLVWLLNDHSVCLWQSPNETLYDALCQLPVSQSSLKVVRAIAPDYIWRTVLYFPLIEEYQLYKHLIDHLKQQLPIPLEQVYFDYHIELQPTHLRIKVAVFALRREYADRLLLTTETILDCQLHCYQRGFQYFLPEIKHTMSPICYQLDEFSFQYESDNIIFNPVSTQNTTHHINELCLPDDLPDRTLYLAALGAALWSGKA